MANSTTLSPGAGGHSTEQYTISSDRVATEQQVFVMCTWYLSQRSQHRTAVCLVTHDASGVGFDDCKQTGTD